jgi:hypothetical protein
MDNSTKPMYQPWNEEEFQADVFVRGMTWLQRHLYRALLQASFFHGTRPYLPNDDEVLWVLSGAESPEMWEQNKARILKRFTPAVHDANLLENKRVTADWERLMNKREKMSDMGRTSAEKRKAALSASPDASNIGVTGVVRVLSASSTSEVKLSEVKQSEEKESQASEFSVSSDSVSQEQNTGGTWKNLSIRHFRLFGGKKPSVKFTAQYAAACLKYGEQIVLDCFDSWANGSAAWIKSQNIEQPLFIFFKNLDKEAEDAMELAEALKEDDSRIEQEKRAVAERGKQAAAAQDESIERQTQEIIARRDARPAVSEVSLEDFLEAK